MGRYFGRTTSAGRRMTTTGVGRSCSRDIAACCQSLRASNPKYAPSTPSSVPTLAQPKKLFEAPHAARDGFIWAGDHGQHVTSGVVASARAGALNIAARKPGHDRYSAANLFRTAE